MVNTIVCAYSGYELTTSWLQVFNRFEHAVERAGLRVRVRLSPLEDLPESFEVLVVAPEFAEPAAAVAAGARVIITTRQQAASAVAELLRELESGESLYAERARPDDPKIVVHRGPEIL